VAADDYDDDDVDVKLLQKTQFAFLMRKVFPSIF
jgi:hypothetical protein